ncbi:MAG: M50 family metallopeptidase, partial [Gemmatimonadales bacterium]
MREYKLRGDLTIVEQTYRGEQTYIVKEHVEHRYYAFSFIEVLVMQQFDGERTCAAIAAGLTEEGLTINEGAVESFARKLVGMGLLEQSVAERSVLLMERVRAQRNRRVNKESYQGTFLRMRWSAGDPNQFFNTWTPRLGFFFSTPFVVISIALFIAYFGIVITRQQAFIAALSTMYHPGSWSLGFIVIFWCTGLTVIAIHEFGHGFACKYFGGDVHEMGAMLIYLQPAFYCNVNDAWTFPELKARLWVTAAGSWIQMVVAGVAAIVWWAVEPDTVVSQVALVAVLIGGAMTLLANANPLIPLDGYYALSDFLGVPNLRKRAFQYVDYAFKHRVLRLAVPAPQVTTREKRIFLIYG